jgi:serine protease Do
MKKGIVSRIVLAGMALLSVPFLGLAQKEKDKEKDKQMQTIVITREPGDGKTVIEIDGDKVKINGKDAKDNKDVNVNVTTLKGARGRNLFMHNNAAGQTWNMNFDNRISLFEEDANRGMLGVQMEEHEKGALVKSVTKESAAEKAGIKSGDVITRIDDKKIEDADDVTEEIKKHKPGEKVTVTYLRDSKEHKAAAELTKWKGIKMNAMSMPRVYAPATPDGPMEFNMPMQNFNFDVYAGRPKLGISIQDTEDGKGVKILDVEEESSAAKAGLKKDDVILAIDDKEVNSTDAISRLMRGAERDRFNYSFRILRDGKTQTVDVKIPRKLKTADL